MSVQHTPGPWSFEVHELSEGPSAIVYDEHGQRIADHLTEQRARMIAAAPEMYEACKALRSRLLAFVGAMALHTDCSGDVDAITKADAALAKSEAP